ncbi:MOSC domain-containing protein [Nocardia sp. NPDC050175]|uniref:MOSC domain-containing protein n=1 Tax=Nocardia sp. NPDC050175 TaxID=3364317 RepID=UPI00379E4DA3
MNVATVAALHTYPVKSCAGIALDDGVLTPAGLVHDRSFLVVDSDGGFRSQRSDPRLASIRPEISTDGTQLALHAPDIDPFRLTVDPAGPRRAVTLFGAPFEGLDQGHEVAEWISTVLGASTGLVRVPPDHHRVTDGLTPGTSAYADSCPVHIISLSSVRDLNQRIAARGGQPVPVDRFRPNLVLDGVDQPYLEDELRRITIGDTELGYAKLAIRCAITMVHQQTGSKAGHEPLRTLAGYRRTAGGVAIGAKFAVVRPGKISVGDPVDVIDWGRTEL